VGDTTGINSGHIARFAIDDKKDKSVDAAKNYKSVDALKNRYHHAG